MTINPRLRLWSSSFIKAEGTGAVNFGRDVTSHTPLTYPFRIAYLVKLLIFIALMKKYSLIIVVFCSMARGAFAGEFKPAQVPANSQWYLHFDVDGFKKGPLGKFALEQVSKEAGQIDALALLTQFDPRKDLHGITLFGSVVKDDLIGTVLVNGSYKKLADGSPAPLAQLEALLESTATGFKKEQINGVEILSWKNKVEDTQEDKQSFGTFFDKEHMLFGDDRKQLLHALNVLAKKAPSLKASTLKGLAKEKGNHYIVGLLHMKGIPIPPEANFMENVTTIGVSMGESEENLSVSMQMITTDEEACAQLQLIMQGFVALAHLSLINNKEPGSKEAMEIFQKINITIKNKTVFMNLSYPMGKILELARLQLAKEQ